MESQRPSSGHCAVTETMGNCSSYDSDDGFSYHPDDELCEHCNCPIPPGNQILYPHPDNKLPFNPNYTPPQPHRFQIP
ncbi:hypothetical protein HF521_021885 [Silurus meridionalis]|uniref:Uncharacterized protein n=1 Tax=Silurus meridionalis TaxID=175797 RepID=A0A8T0BFE1_SILME|nr:hypothetical protein HF521_021885 [Silurus meridionalis]